MIRTKTSNAWVKQDYSEFRRMIDTEIWLIERFDRDFVSYYVADFVDWTDRVLPSNIPRRASFPVVRYA
jgi:hypothetical protein